MDSRCFVQCILMIYDCVAIMMRAYCYWMIGEACFMLRKDRDPFFKRNNRKITL